VILSLKWLKIVQNGEKRPPRPPYFGFLTPWEYLKIDIKTSKNPDFPDLAKMAFSVKKVRNFRKFWGPKIGILAKTPIYPSFG
jgi:hypothetical protein